MENIIVTGGLGFIGVNLLSYLSNKKKYFIHNIDNFSLKHTYFDSYLSERQKSLIKTYQININNAEEIRNILIQNKIKKIFHLAAESHVDRSILGPKNFFDSNVMGTLNLVEECRHYINKHKINDFKFLHVSTDEVFGDLTINDDPFHENSPYNPSSPYSASKAASDFIIKSWFRTYNFPGIITNCSNNFGPCQNLEKFIPLSIHKLLNKKIMGIYGNGSNIRDWLYVLDHVKTLYKIINDGNTGEVYCIGGNNEFSNLDIFKNLHLIISKEMKLKILNLDKSFNFIEDRLGHDFRYAINSKKIETKFNIKIKTDMDSYLKKTIEFYLNKF